MLGVVVMEQNSGLLQIIIIGISEQPWPDNFQNRKNEQGCQIYDFFPLSMRSGKSR
jgi:predicted secreted protein